MNKILNGLCGCILLFIGANKIIDFFVFNSNVVPFVLVFGVPILTLFWGIALIFLGIYVFRCKKLAIKLSGILGVLWILGLALVAFSMGLTDDAFFDFIPAVILIINWLVFAKAETMKDKINAMETHKD